MTLTDKAKERIRLIFSICLSFLIALTGIAFAVSCYSIYISGEAPFSRESVSAAFRVIAPIVYVTLAALLVSIAVWLWLPYDEERPRASRNLEKICASLYERLDTDALGDEERSCLDKLHTSRRKSFILHTVLNISSFLVPLIILLNPNLYSADHASINMEVMNGMVFYTIFAVPVFVENILYKKHITARLECEIGILRSAISQGRVKKDAENQEKNHTDIALVGKIKHYLAEHSREITLGARIAFVGCAVLFIILGIANGGMRDVLIKAVNICTECIGLG